jgi:hypothetical protein
VSSYLYSNRFPLFLYNLVTYIQDGKYYFNTGFCDKKHKILVREDVVLKRFKNLTKDTSASFDPFNTVLLPWYISAWLLLSSTGWSNARVLRIPCLEKYFNLKKKNLKHFRMLISSYRIDRKHKTSINHKRRQLECQKLIHCTELTKGNLRKVINLQKRNKFSENTDLIYFRHEGIYK